MSNCYKHLDRVANEQFTFWIVVFQPIFKGSAYEATADNTYVDHCGYSYYLLFVVFLLMA